jgi:TPP-dependent pyruvate/acetoin dehydrogenase alpha subunit
MTDKKPDPKKVEITTEVLLADVMLRITAIEKLLIEKGIFTQEELSTSTDEIAKRVAKVVLEKAQASKSVDEFINTLENSDKKIN